MLLLFLSLSSRKKSNFIIRSDRHLLTKAIACVSKKKSLIKSCSACTFGAMNKAFAGSSEGREIRRILADFI